MTPPEIPNLCDKCEQHMPGFGCLWAENVRTWLLSSGCSLSSLTSEQLKTLMNSPKNTPCARHDTPSETC